MRSRSLPSLFLALATGVLVAGADSVADEGKKLEGTWVVEKSVVSGKEAVAMVGAVYEFKGGKLTMTPAKKDMPLPPLAYEVLAPDPKGGQLMRIRIGAAGANGKPERNSLDGVFRITGDKLELCHCEEPADYKLTQPPSSLSSEPKSNHRLSILKKK